MSQNQNDYQENTQAERSYGTNEIFALANRSCLIGFNDLMKNVYIVDDAKERKSLAKKNKIQVSYVDLSKKGQDGKYPKHDFFIDPEEMKYFVEVVYESVVDQSLQSVIRKNGHKFMGGSKKPQIISNIITFKFLTPEELKNSPNNKKILDRFQNDSAKYDNAMLDWKNLQIATLQFDKQHGRDMNGLIVPTGKRIDGVNFKPYYLTFKDLLELTVTMRDHIKHRELQFQLEAKMLEMEKRMAASYEKTLKNVLADAFRSFGGNVSQQPVQTQRPQENVNQTQQQTQQTQNNQQSNPQSQQSPQPNVDQERQAKMKAESEWLFKEGKEFFLKHFKDTQMHTFLDSLSVDSFNFENNALHIEVKFSSGMFDINDFAKEKTSFNGHFQRGLAKVLESSGKKYQATINQL